MEFQRLSRPHVVFRPADDVPLDEFEEDLVAKRVWRRGPYPFLRYGRQAETAIAVAQISRSRQRAQELFCRDSVRSALGCNRLDGLRAGSNRIEDAELGAHLDRSGPQHRHVRVHERDGRNAERHDKLFEWVFPSDLEFHVSTLQRAIDPSGERAIISSKGDFTMKLFSIASVAALGFAASLAAQTPTTPAAAHVMGGAIMDAKMMA